MVFIGFIAEKESGKTTTFNFVKAYFPGATEIMLAQHLKEVCAKVTGLELFCFEDNSEKKKLLPKPIKLTREMIEDVFRLFELNPGEEAVEKHVGKELETTRRVLQYIGTDILRDVEDNIHLRWSMRRTKPAEIYVITDIRFQNEFAFFEKYPNFIPFYIDRSKSTAAGVGESHASESGIQNLRKLCLSEIDNNGDLDHLKDQIATKIVAMTKAILR